MVNITADNVITSIRLMDISGREVIRMNSINRTEVNMPINDVSPGIYIIAVESNGRITAQRLMVR